MLLYSDSYIQKMEFECKWIDSFRYLYHEWTEDKNNIALFLKFSVNTWYILTLDGSELTLNKKQFDMLTCALSECLSYLKMYFRNKTMPNGYLDI